MVWRDVYGETNPNLRWFLALYQATNNHNCTPRKKVSLIIIDSLFSASIVHLIPNWKDGAKSPSVVSSIMPNKPKNNDHTDNKEYFISFYIVVFIWSL